MLEEWHGQSPIHLPLEPDVHCQNLVRKATNGHASSLRVTCQVVIDVVSKPWKLYSIDADGKRKHHGGDEFLLRYEEYTPRREDDSFDDKAEDIELQAVAIPTDHGDGSYSLGFVSTPMHPKIPAQCSDQVERVLSIHFEYTNGIGFMPPPTKAAWSNGGYTHRSYSLRDCPHRPPITPFRRPNSTADIDLGIYEKVFAFGDSAMDQFVRQRPNKKDKYYFQPRIRVGEKLRLPLNSETVEEVLSLLEEDFGSDLVQTAESSDPDRKGVALIVGSCLWDVLGSEDTLQGSDYADHAEACRTYLQGIRERYPHVTVFWKSPSAVHVHVVDLDRVIQHDKEAASLFGTNRLRHMSASRSKHLYTLQKEIMKELDVPVLDVYEATYLSSDMLYPSDGRHYRPDLNRIMLSWFYPNRTKMQPKYFQNLPF